MPQDLSLLPEVPALANDDSMLTRKFGKEVVNYYSGSRLNRYSFLRADSAFLRRAAASPRARFYALENLNPVVTETNTLASLTLADVAELVGKEPFKLEENDAIAAYDSTVTAPILVFLGMMDAAEAAAIETTGHGEVKGDPVFAVDLSATGSHAEAAKTVIEGIKARGFSVEPNPRSMRLLPEFGKRSVPAYFSLTHVANYP